MKYFYLLMVLFFCSSFSFADEMSERSELTENARKLFMAENYSELTRLADKYIASQERTSSGVWKLTPFTKGIVTLADYNNRDEKYWTDLDGRLKRWIKSQPNSPTAYNVYAQFMILRAWMSEMKSRDLIVRNPKYDDIFIDDIAKAHAFLLENKAVAAKDPQYYEAMMLVAQQELWADEYDEVVKEGMERFPYFYEIYFSAFKFVNIKWGGQKSNIESLADEFVKRTSDKEKTGAYARYYWYAYQVEFGRELFSKTSMDWEKMKISINDVLEKYPDQWNINNLGAISCLAKDKETTKSLISKIQGVPMAAAWGRGGFFEKCNSWSKSS